MMPQPRDVLVSNRSASLEHDVSIVPEPPHLMCGNRQAALARGRELAETLRVDLWLTEDHTHFMLIASHRELPVEGSRRSGADSR
jgi:hypothetical protein